MASKGNIAARKRINRVCRLWIWRQRGCGSQSKIIRRDYKRMAADKHLDK